MSWGVGVAPVCGGDGAPRVCYVTPPGYPGMPGGAPGRAAGISPPRLSQQRVDIFQPLLLLPRCLQEGGWESLAVSTVRVWVRWVKKVSAAALVILLVK